MPKMQIGNNKVFYKKQKNVEIVHKCPMLVHKILFLKK
jgi:hypothetical protein